jgi:hypothetical protein
MAFRPLGQLNEWTSPVSFMMDGKDLICVLHLIVFLMYVDVFVQPVTED